MPVTTRAMTEFQNRWDAARRGGEQSYKVSYGELSKALDAVKADGKVTKAEAKFVADTIAHDPVLTRPATELAKEFLATVAGPKLDATTRSAVMAEFAAVAAKPFSHLQIPGRVVKNSVDLPEGVQKAVKDTAEQGGGTWESVEVRKTTLAGQPVFVVDYSSLDGEFDYEKVRIFSAQGKLIAEGGINDAMAGFAWH